MKPGAHLPYSKASGTISCSDLVKKSVALLDNKKGDQNLLIADKALDRSPLMISPVSPLKQNNVLQVDVAKALDGGVIEGTPTNRSPVFYSPINYSRQNNLLRTPKTPRFEDCDSESMLEALTVDLLVFFMSLELLYVVLSLFAFWILSFLEHFFYLCIFCFMYYMEYLAEISTYACIARRLIFLRKLRF